MKNLLACLILVMLSGRANALLITQEFDETVPAGSTLELETFDPSLGTLTEIWFGFQLSSSVSGSEFTCEGLPSCRIDTGIFASWGLPGVFAAPALIVDLFFTGSAEELKTRTFVTVVQNTNKSFSAPFDNLSDLTRGPISIVTIYSTAIGGNPLTVISSDIRISGTLAFEYDPVPTPSTLALFAIALAGLRVARQRGKVR